MNNIFQQYREKENISLHKLGLRLGITAQGAKYLCDRPVEKLGVIKLDTVMKAEELGIPVLDVYAGYLMSKKKTND